LIVQVSVPDDSRPGVATTDPQASGWDISFVLDVQRQDTTISTSPVAVPVRGLGEGISVLPLGPGGGWAGGRASPPAGTWSSCPEDGGAPLAADAAQPTRTGEELTGEHAGTWDGFTVRVALGPMASRIASPLGPALATVQADLAPPADRHERAL